jgi:hypothetical protein
MANGRNNSKLRQGIRRLTYAEIECPITQPHPHPSF